MTLTRLTQTHTLCPHLRASLPTCIPSVSHLQQFIWGLLPPFQEGGACVPTPSSPSAPGIPPAWKLGDLGQVSSPLVSPSPLCNGTAGFLGGTVEDSVSRGPPVLLAPTLPWPARCPQGGFQEDRKAQLPRSHASRKSGNQKPRLPEAPSGGLVGPDTLWGTPLVPVWSPGRAVGWGEETGWSEPLPLLGAGVAPTKSGDTEAEGTEDCGSHRKVRASAPRVVQVH